MTTIRNASSVLALVAVAGLASADNLTQIGPGTPVDTDSPWSSRTSIVWDNGGTDGSNGYSEAEASVFGAYRSTLDDFTLTAATSITGFFGQYISFSGALPAGTGMNISFYADAAGTPGAFIATTSSTGYSEALSGNNWFGRDEVVNHATFSPVVLGAGTYWVEMQIVNVENDFHMVHAGTTGSEAWVNYADIGTGPGSVFFGTAADMAFALEGDVIPAPSAVALLGLAGLAGRRRR